MQTTISKFVEDADYILLIHWRCRLSVNAKVHIERQKNLAGSTEVRQGGTATVEIVTEVEGWGNKRTNPSPTNALMSRSMELKPNNLCIQYPQYDPVQNEGTSDRYSVKMWLFSALDVTKCDCFLW